MSTSKAAAFSSRASDRGFKSWASKEEVRARRRRELLARQRKDRRNFRDHIRNLAEKVAQRDEDAAPSSARFPKFGNEGTLVFDSKVGGGAEGSKGKGVKMDAEKDPEAEAKKRARKQAHLRRRREFFARQLMYPEWMTDIPRDLAESWYVLPRPEGVRCLVISSRGKTISRKKSGSILHNFQSALPNGHKDSRSPEPCILDCVYQSQNQTYYVLDLMCWNGYPIYDSNTEFRHFWVHSKLSEVPIHKKGENNKFKFAPVPRFVANTDGLKKSYNEKHGFQMDGLLFINKETHYELGLSPLCLVWKDSKTSRYFVDTSDGTKISERQSCTLHLSKEGKVTSLEEYVVGKISPQTVGASDLKFDSLCKFTITGIQQTEDKKECAQGLTYLAPGSQARMLPDSWSKILFQFLARRKATPTILDIAKVSATSHLAPNQKTDETISSNPSDTKFMQT